MANTLTVSLSGILVWSVALVPLMDRLAGRIRLAESLIVFSFLIISQGGISKRAFIPAGIICLLAVSVLVSERSLFDESPRQFISLLLSASFFYLVCNLNTPKPMKKFFVALVLIGTFNSLILIFSSAAPDVFSFLVWETSEAGRKVAGVRLPFVRSAGMFNHYAYNAGFTIASLFAATRLIKDRYPLILVKPMIIIMLFGLIFSQSRLSWIVVALYAAFILVYLQHHSLGIKKILIRAFLLAILCAVVVNLFAIIHTLVSVKTNTVYARLDQIAVGLQIFLESPVLGSGYQSYFSNNPSHVMHNGLVIILYSGGIIGMLLFLVIVFIPVLASLRRQHLRTEVLFLTCGGIFVMMASSGVSFYSIWLLFGLCYLIVFYERKPRPVQAVGFTHN